VVDIAWLDLQLSLPDGTAAASGTIGSESGRDDHRRRRETESRENRENSVHATTETDIQVLSARRYASAAYVMGLCLSVTSCVHSTVKTSAVSVHSTLTESDRQLLVWSRDENKTT